MVKKGGTKRKIAIEKIEKTESLRVTCTKRREGLFSKAAQLCLLSGSQIAILVTPPSTESNVFFYSFGHSSVDSVVSAFLSEQSPLPVRVNREMREDVGESLARKDMGLGFWWDQERLLRSENPEELREAVDSMSKLLNHVRNLRSGEPDHYHLRQTLVNDHKNNLMKEKSDVALENGTQEPDQTLTLQSTTCTICCIPDDVVVPDNDLPANLNHNNAYYLDYDQNVDYDQIVDITQFIDFDTPFDFETDFDDWINIEKTHYQKSLEEISFDELTDNHSHHQAFVNDHEDDDLKKKKSDDQTLITNEENSEETDQIREICGSFLLPGSCLGF